MSVSKKWINVRILIDADMSDMPILVDNSEVFLLSNTPNFKVIQLEANINHEIKIGNLSQRVFINLNDINKTIIMSSK